MAYQQIVRSANSSSGKFLTLHADLKAGERWMLKWGKGELSFERASKLEWLETNGLGGYAAGTVAGVRTRRYHGLLIASLYPPTQRTLLFAGTDEQVNDGGQVFNLTAHLFRDGTATAWTQPTEFCLDWCPKWLYELPNTSIVKQVFMPYMRNAVIIRYFAKASRQMRLSVRLFVAWRDHHWTMQPVVPFEVREGKSHLVVQVGQPLQTVCHLAHNGDSFSPECRWWHNFWLPTETERGLDDTESLFCVGTVVKDFDGCGHLDIVASVEPVDVDEVAELEERERKRRSRLAARLQSDYPLLATLLRAADAFIALRSSTGTRTIVAGYPWFTDWGRDALISLPGLTLVTKRFAVAREILLTFARYISEGLVPNFFPEGSDLPAYNTVDATLWFVLAAYRYLRYTRDEETLCRLWDVLREILFWHLKGTRFGICADPKDGLLSWGSSSVNEALTWMDAKVWGKPVTPRSGKPVEVNALWCNALEILAHIAKLLGDRETEKLASQTAAKAKRHFEPSFWNSERNCLFDVLALDGTPDSSVRCNQLLALSLPFRLLSPEKERSVLKVVESELLTPCGLRTLSPKDPNYIGRYIGPPHERDAAYHQGTVWAWWFGPYADAVALVEGKSSVQRKVRLLLENFLRRHLRESCVGQVSEIFDGDEPHEPRGCFAQAWSVAEILRAWYERVEGKLPPPLWDES
jgi:predicted glycogen debranching enzyme